MAIVNDDDDSDVGHYQLESKMGYCKSDSKS
jgi:hypothetical protein